MQLLHQKKKTRQKSKVIGLLPSPQGLLKGEEKGERERDRERRYILNLKMSKSGFQKGREKNTLQEASKEELSD